MLTGLYYIMPSSRYEVIPAVLDIVTQLHPKSILDIGIGTGKYGMLFREYLDVWDISKPYKKKGLYLIGIEAFAEYDNPIWQVYDKVVIEDVRNLATDSASLMFMEKIKVSFDLLFMGDVIEHFEKEEAKHIIGKLNHKHIVIVTPLNVLKQEAVYNNEFEIHRSEWKHQDFPNLEHKIIGNQQIFYG